MSTAILQNEKEKMLVPQLRFEGFEGEWTVNKLGNYCNFSQGVQVDLELQLQEPKDGYTRFIRIENYTQKSNDFRYIPNKLTNKKSIDENEIAVVRYGATAGYIGRGLKGVLANNLFKVLPNIEILNTSYLFEFLNGYKAFSFFQTEMSGGAMPALSFGIVNALTISFPALPEQQKIASFLSAVDEKIQQLSRKKELLEQYKKGVMQQLFSGKLRFKDENGKDYADWEEKKLGDVAEKRIVKNKDNKINLVFTNSALQGIVNQRDFFDKDIANQNNLLGYYIVEKNDFVYNPRISTYAPVGPISRNHLETGIMSPLYSVFRFKYGNFDFIEYFFNSSVWHLHMKDISNYGARDDRMSFSTSDFYKMPIPFPCIEEQQKIATFLSSIDTKIESASQQMNQTQSFKKGLLQQLFV